MQFKNKINAYFSISYKLDITLEYNLTSTGTLHKRRSMILVDVGEPESLIEKSKCPRTFE
jgi:hypothetical protein